ncbi:DUF2252 family protein [Lichenibacterium dinghuense]|uniref:DUF2252 family protein n=1 Tax=Lichenibacterium dinghuense TaxID=2895977 RepID=UPI001F326CA8|nr:DUF2252 family protein [Lichenibacterium sp. 6Y81]
MPTDRRSVAEFPSLGERAGLLERKRALKMARSAHAYVRGATARFYDWLGAVDAGLVPSAPPVWICGDCHLGNLGPLADAAGKVRIRIRDLDQTVLGNPAHDVIRLGLSLSTAARGSDLPGVTTAHMLEEMVHGYCDALLGHDESLSEARAGRAVRAVLRQATHRRWEHLAQERLERVEPSIPLGKRFWPLSDEERRAIAALVSSEAAQALVGALHGRGRHHAVTVLDAAYWMKGCSSLGTLRYAVLLRVGGHGGSGKAKASYCLIDIKEAVASVAPAAPGAPAEPDHAARVVSGARALSPCLGDRMLPARLLGRPVVMRELMPQDLKLEIDQLTREEAVGAARFLAAVVGHSHARQMAPADRRAWADELKLHHGGGLDAPSWLWTTVVELVAHHERGYLDHCRDFALARAG